MSVVRPQNHARFPLACRLALLRTYACTECGFSRSIAFIPRAYRLASGELLPMPQLHTWCEVCKTISVVESLKRMNEFLDNKRFDMGLASILARRSKPQRCLICGNTDIPITNDDLMDLPHHPCIGTLQCKFKLFGGQMTNEESYRVMPHVYNEDGDLLSVGEQASKAPLPLVWPIDWITWRPMWG